VPNKTIEIRLDKLDDAYGSPGLEDIERFSRGLAQVRHNRQALVVCVHCTAHRPQLILYQRMVAACSLG
jgi:hypothetical protein